MKPLTTARRALACAVLLMGATVAQPLVAHGKPPSPPKPPGVFTGGTTQLTFNSATLTGTVNPHGLETSYYFQYGSTSAYGSQTTTVSAGNGTAAVHAAQPLAGLQVGGEYHYRLVAVSSAGTSFGGDRTFTTKKVSLKFELPKAPRLTTFGKPISIAGSLTGTAAAGQQVVLQASPFPFLGGFSDIGPAQTTSATGGFSFLLSGLSRNTQVRVALLGAATSFSPVITVRVAPRVTLRVHRTRRAGYVRFSGSVAPAVSGASVSFQLIRPGRGPLTVGGATVVGGKRFSAVVFIKHGLGGEYRALLSTDGGRFAPGASRWVHVPAAPAHAH